MITIFSNRNSLRIVPCFPWRNRERLLPRPRGLAVDRGNWCKNTVVSEWCSGGRVHFVLGGVRMVRSPLCHRQKTTCKVCESTQRLEFQCARNISQLDLETENVLTPFFSRVAPKFKHLDGKDYVAQMCNPSRSMHDPAFDTTEVVGSILVGCILPHRGKVNRSWATRLDYLI